MKNYKDMARDVLHRIDEYENERKRKQIKLKKTAAFAAPACAAAVAGIFLWKGGADLDKRGQIVGTVADTSVSAIVSADNSNSAADISNTSATAGKNGKSNGQTTETTVRADNKETTAAADKQSSDTTGTSAKDGGEPKTAETQTASSEQSISLSNSSAGDRDGDAVINGEYYLQTSPDVTYTADRYIGCGSDFDGFYKNRGTSAEFYTVKESADIVLVKLGNGGQVYLKRTNEAPPETPSLITSYPITASASYAAPPNGECGLSVGLYYAMEDYAGSADYLLKGDIFSDNHKIFDREVLQAEAERLSSLGYNVKVVSESMQSGEDYYYLTLTLTYEQIRNFPEKDNYGYFLMLYDGS